MQDVDRPTGYPGGRRTTPAGLVGLLGLFAGLLAVFASVVTSAEWLGERGQARWPIVSALIEHGEVAVQSANPHDGRGTYWKLRYRVRYEVDSQERIASLSSHGTNSSEDAAKLRRWVAQHRRGDRIDVRYDPAQPTRAIFASADVPNIGSGIGTGMTLAIVSSLICVLLLALAKHMESKEAMETSSADVSAAGRVALGLLCSGMGVFAIGLGAYSALHATHGLTSTDFIFVPAALIFVFGGVLVGLPPGWARLHHFFGALLVTAFAVTFDWIAFGPGERRFGGQISIGIGVGLQPNEIFGRATFGICALILDLVALASWGLVWRRQ